MRQRALALSRWSSRLPSRSEFEGFHREIRAQDTLPGWDCGAFGRVKISVLAAYLRAKTHIGMHQNVAFEQHYDVFVHFYNAHSQTHNFFALGYCVKTSVSLESGHRFDEMTSAESAEIAPAFLFYKKTSTSIFSIPYNTFALFYSTRCATNMNFLHRALGRQKKNVFLLMRVWPLPNAHSHKCKM